MQGGALLHPLAIDPLILLTAVKRTFDITGNPMLHITS
jgi:hypothetical protein